MTTAPEQPSVKPKKSRRGAKIAWSIVGGVVVLIVLISIISSLAGGGTPTAANTPAANVATAPTTASTPAAPKTPAAPQATVAQQQALIAAKQYLAMGSGFSYKSLLDQLTSSAGNGFGKADAIWAIAHSGANWNAQAVDAAKGYLAMGGFSHNSLIEQLTSSAGNQFTKAQAEYAAKKVGL